MFTKPSVASLQLVAGGQGPCTAGSVGQVFRPAGGEIKMTEDDLRGLVREAVARRLAQHGLVPPSPVPPSMGAAPAWRTHVSHVRLVLSTGRDQDGPCLVEPVTRCSHCGYCQSYGH